MLKGLYTAYTGMINEQHRMDVMTNNLANANTNGYKKEGATSQAFSDVFAFKLKDTSEAARTTRSIGINNLGVKIGEGYTDYSQGPRAPRTAMIWRYQARVSLQYLIPIKIMRLLLNIQGMEVSG